MSSVVQTQQANQAAIAVSIGSASSCIQHLPDYHWHVHFGDFKAICGHAVSADCLRAFEMMTDARVTKLRKSFGIPANRMPHEDDLWIEASTPDIDFWTLHVRDQSTYWYCLQEQSYPGRAKSLLELGFLRRRFVAYPGRYMVEPVATMIHLDMQSNPFIIVDDDKQGYYVGTDGELHSAADEGYTVMRRQYLCCFDDINAALAKLVGQLPAKPMKRWHSLQKKKALTGETTNLRPSEGQPPTASQSSAPLSNDDIQKKGRQSLLFADKHNTEQQSLSLEMTENHSNIVELHNNSSVLLSAPWCAETLIALVRYYLAVPDREECDEEQWRRDWLEPAQWLIELTAHLDCSRAWEDIELHIAAMIAGPTWHAREANKPFVEYGTLRHVIGFHKETGELDGHNWKSTADALRKEAWKDYVPIEYKGPPLFDDTTQSSSAQSEPSYAQGYSAQSPQIVDGSARPLPDDEHTEQIVEVVAQAVSTEHCDECSADEVSALSTEHNNECADDQCLSIVSAEQPMRDTEELEAVEQSVSAEHGEEATQYFTGTELAMQIIDGDAQGMTSLVAARLRTLIRRDCPDIIIANQKIDGYCLVAMQIALDTWYYLGSLDDWNRQSPETQEAVIAAEAYARQRNAAQSNVNEDSQGPPGYDGAGEEGGDSTGETREER